MSEENQRGSGAFAKLQEERAAEKLLREKGIAEGTEEQVGPKGTLPVGWNRHDVYLSSTMILVFGFLTFLIMAGLLLKGRKAMDVIRMSSLPLVIISALFLVVIGYSAEQIAPVLGLLGSIVGYLLGTANQTGSSSSGDPKKPG